MHVHGLKVHDGLSHLFAFLPFHKSAKYCVKPACCDDNNSMHFCAIHAGSYWCISRCCCSTNLGADDWCFDNHLAVKTSNGSVLAALLFLVIAIIIMILWTFCSVCYDFWKAKKFKTKCKRVLVNFVIGVGGCLYLIGDNLPPILQLRSNVCEQLVHNITGVQLMNATCGQLLTNFTLGQLTDHIPGVTIVDLLNTFNLTTYGKVLIGLSVFLFSMFPACVFKFNTHEELEEIIKLLAVGFWENRHMLLDQLPQANDYKSGQWYPCEVNNADQ